MKKIRPEPEELTDILDSLQEQIEGAKDLHHVEALKGSYGVYLHSLRHNDPRTAQLYIDWMKNYNNTHVSAVKTGVRYD